MAIEMVAPTVDQKVIEMVDLTVALMGETTAVWMAEAKVDLTVA